MDILSYYGDRINELVITDEWIEEYVNDELIDRVWNTDNNKQQVLLHYWYGRSRSG